MTFLLIALIVVWSTLDALLPIDSPLPDYSVQWGLSITVVAMTASLLYLQARVAQIAQVTATKEDLGSAEARLDELSSGLAVYARRTEDIARRSAPNQIEGPLIAKELEALLATESAMWKFRGGSGRWQREVVLPTLAKVRDRDVAYTMLILDPREDHLCNLYARYRNTHRHDEEIETASSIRLQLTACIVAAVWASLRSRVKPNIRLGQVYSPLRLDLGVTGAMMTVSDPEQPGLMAASDSWFYKSLHDELDRAVELAPQVTVQRSLLDKFNPNSKLDDVAVRAVLSAAMVDAEGDNKIELFTEKQLDDLDLVEIARMSWAHADAAIVEIEAV